MFRNYLSTCLILLGLVCFGVADESYAGPLEELAQADADWKSGQFGRAESGYKAVASNYLGTNYALTAQKKLVMLYKHDQPKAKAAFQELVANFSTHEQIANAVYDIAVHYREIESYKKYEMVKLFCQHILDNWPDSEWAIWAQSKIAVSNVILGEESSAEAAFNTLISNFSDHEHVAKAAYDVAHEYNLAGNYNKAERLYQRIINTWLPAKHMMWIHVDLAHSYIPRDNNAIARAAIDALVENISSHEFIPGALYDIAQHYERVNKYAKARQVYQEVVNKAPQDYYGMWSQMGVVLSSISFDDGPAAQAATDKLITDYSDNERLSDAVHAVAVQYDAAGKYEKAEQYYQYVLDHWPNHDHHAIWTRVERAHLNINFGNEDKATAIIDELVAKLQAGSPVYSYWPAVAGEAYCHAGGCYRKIGKYQKALDCYLKVVQDYPTHRNACLSQCSIGSCYEGLKQSGALSESEADLLTEQAYQAVIENYGDCSSVEYASWRLGQLNFEQQQWGEAAQYFELFREKKPEDCRLNHVLYDLGRAYEQMGERGLAVGVYREFIERYPENSRVEDLVARFEEL